MHIFRLIDSYIAIYFVFAVVVSGAGSFHQMDNAEVTTTYKSVHPQPHNEHPQVDAIDFHGEVVNSDVFKEDLLVTVYWGHTVHGHWLLTPLGQSKRYLSPKPPPDGATEEEMEHHLKTRKEARKQYEFRLERRLLAARRVPVDDSNSNLCLQITGPVLDATGMFCVANPLTRRIFYVHMEINFDAAKPPKPKPVPPPPPPPSPPSPPPSPKPFAPHKHETIALKGHVTPVDPAANYIVYVGFDPENHHDYEFKTVPRFSSKTKENSAFLFNIGAAQANQAAERVRAHGRDPVLCIWVEKHGTGTEGGMPDSGHHPPCLQTVDNFFGEKPLSRSVVVDLRKLTCAEWLFPKPPEPRDNVMIALKGALLPPSPDYRIEMGFDIQDMRAATWGMRVRERNNAATFSFQLKAKDIKDKEKLCLWVQKTDVRTDRCHLVLDVAALKHDGNKRLIGEIDLATVPGCEPLLPPKPAHSHQHSADGTGSAHGGEGDEPVHEVAAEEPLQASVEAHPAHSSAGHSKAKSAQNPGTVASHESVVSTGGTRHRRPFPVVEQPAPVAVEVVGEN